MAKKDKAKMTEEKSDFVSGCVKNGIEKEKAETLFDNISGFAKYAFNKSHGMAYAYLTYETAYLKALYPAEYFAARLECEGSLKRTEAYAYEMGKFSLRLLPPCINRSGVSFEPCDHGVRYSLSAIKGVGKSVASRIVKEREASGEFKDADDFIWRVGSSIGLNSAYALVKSGALDVFGETRKTLYNLCEDTVSSGFNMAVSDDQLSLSFDNVESVRYPRRTEKEFPETEKRLFEKEYTGVDFHFVKSNFSVENTAKQYALYIKLTPTNKEALRLVSALLSEDRNGSVVRIYDVETGKTSQLKDRFFIPTISSVEEIEKIMGKENVLLKALERNKK
jgi:DNA polymerase-3 subunit alpha